MRLVVNYDYVSRKHHAKIYYHDKVNNIARLLVDQIDLLSLNGSNDLLQGEVMEDDKKIKDPEFAVYDFEEAKRRRDSLRSSVISQRSPFTHKTMSKNQTHSNKSSFISNTNQKSTARF